MAGRCRAVRSYTLAHRAGFIPRTGRVSISASNGRDTAPLGFTSTHNLGRGASDAATSAVRSTAEDHTKHGLATPGGGRAKR